MTFKRTSIAYFILILVTNASTDDTQATSLCLQAVLILWTDHFAGLCECGSSETVDSIGPPSARSTSVSQSGWGREEGGGGGGREEGGRGREEGGGGGWGEEGGGRKGERGGGREGEGGERRGRGRREMRGDGI